MLTIAQRRQADDIENALTDADFERICDYRLWLERLMANTKNMMSMLTKSSDTTRQVLEVAEIPKFNLFVKIEVEGGVALVKGVDWNGNTVTAIYSCAPELDQDLSKTQKVFKIFAFDFASQLLHNRSFSPLYRWTLF